MKILELRFKNLNSLYGEWIIDFTDPEYITGGIFALTGATGAGKSTVLDAICLALYGATPRLGKITRGSNEIMSRQTGECYAEVLFASQSGRFRCHWEQRRARKKADGKLQDHEHQISEDNADNSIIESRKSLVGRIVEEKTGMDFDRFTRSVLLAQGGFDTFLKADVEQKSKVLEQLTGTEIYSEISRRVHERQRIEQEKLNLMKSEIAGISILEPEQEQAVRDELAGSREQEAEFIGQAARIGKASAWLTTIRDLKREMDGLAGEADRLNSEAETFRPARIKLDRAVKASQVEEKYAIFNSLNNQQTADQSALHQAEAALPELESLANKQAERLKSSQKITLQAKEKLKTAAPLIQKIRLLDQNIAEQGRAVKKLGDDYAGEAANIEKGRRELAKKRQEIVAAEKRLAAVRLHCQKNAQDEWLIGGLAGIEEQLGSLAAKQQEIIGQKRRLKKSEQALADADRQLEAAVRQCLLKKQELTATSKRLQQGRETLNGLLGDKSLGEYRHEKEVLIREMYNNRKVVELADYREHLEEGQPCPLCGATSHPLIEVPALDEIEQKIEVLTRLIDKAERQEQAVKQLEQEENIARARLNDCEKLEINAANAKKTAEQNQAQLDDNLLVLRAGLEQLELAVLEKLKPLGIDNIAEAKAESLLSSLKARQKKWQSQVKEQGELEKQLADLEHEARHLDTVAGMQVKMLGEKKENLEQLQKNLSASMDERKKYYGSKNPDDEEARLQRAAAAAEQAEQGAAKLHAEHQQELIRARSHIESLKQHIEQRMPALKQMEDNFNTAVDRAGFADQQDFLQARMSDEKRKLLSLRAKELDEAVAAVRIKQQDRRERLAAEIDRKLTDKTFEELDLQLRETSESLKKLQQAIAGLQHRLKENNAAKERLQDKQDAIHAQHKDCLRWEKLNRLIGSADGKKYRNFAQGLTFELMVNHANQQLAKMTDRYLLIRDKEQPLELNVVDNYQAGEIRSTRNLSGGESFIVSLTLALGLSKMASRKVRVDSLFLDEGFGTLDEDAMETALETLSGLQQDGKLIGIISHVPALQERIRTQIHITQVSGGRSLISGPGCSKTA
ncbi:MAG: chromosome segregation protein SMC [Deltaproteobacteria bacterium]|nr:MAG: chromosome segregation protein SMC [Deltaproteobacteria bacterium]